MNNKKAFTMAEVLITITLVGVLAALAMQIVTNNAQERVRLTSARKAEMEVMQAATAVQALCPRWRNCPAGTTVQSNFQNILTDFDKVSFNVGAVNAGSLTIKVDADDDGTSDMEYTANSDGSVDRTAGCNYDGFEREDNNACTAME